MATDTATALAEERPRVREQWGTCGCGCGTPRPARDNHGRRRFYVHGHNTKGRTFPERRQAVIQWRQSHTRAVALKASVTECEWLRIGDCHGRLEVAHVNQDEMDNTPSNLLKLCASHHRLLDKGRIDPFNPVMPSFWTDSSGQRRYFPGGHGKRWGATVAARRDLVAAELDRDPSQSNRAIGRACNIDHKTVARIRRAREELG